MDAYTASQILLTAEEAGERGYDCIEERLDSKVEDYLEPLYRAEEMNAVSFRETQEELDERVADVLATSNIYMEALSSFTEEEDR
ncbi:MAG: hypothetical protein SVU32_03375, partial [Candidatus Nanohaloarchaea archaeon]|nr:hypothetical protein [Candidatus Nanohaloarchaea archaeon]